MDTCRHFRNCIPGDEADELRLADPEPCPVCDANADARLVRVNHLIPAAPVCRAEQPGSTWQAALHRQILKPSCV